MTSIFRSFRPASEYGQKFCAALYFTTNFCHIRSGNQLVFEDGLIFYFGSQSSESLFYQLSSQLLLFLVVESRVAQRMRNSDSRNDSTILLAPTVMEIGVTVQMWTTGSPALSISLTIVAPQRVQVPHVLVRITASTPSAISLFAISAAYAFADATAVPLPTVA